MIYTAQELKQAYCRAVCCELKDLPNQIVEVQKRIDARREEFQAKLDSIPATSQERMIGVALRQLAKESAEQSVKDNAGVEL